jgi:phage protein, HK97 gp10 family
MAKLEFTGIDEYLKQLNTLSDKGVGLCKRAVYDGAAVVAQAVQAEVNSLPVTDHNPEKGETLTVLSYERDGLLEGLGISKIKDDSGYINTKVGFDGYNRLRSKKYPNGHPNQMIARSIESGTSFRRKNPFMSRAIRAAKAKAIAAMDARFSEDIDKIMQR